MFLLCLFVGFRLLVSVFGAVDKTRFLVFQRTVKLAISTSSSIYAEKKLYPPATSRSILTHLSSSSVHGLRTLTYDGMCMTDQIKRINALSSTPLELTFGRMDPRTYVNSRSALKILGNILPISILRTPSKSDFTIYLRRLSSAVFNDFAAPLQDLPCGPGG